MKGENYTNASHAADFYGYLTDIIEIEYEGMVNLRITLCKCKWFDPKIGRGTRTNNSGVVGVLTSRKFNKYEPFILGTYKIMCIYQLKIQYHIHKSNNPTYPYTKKPKREWLNVLKVNLMRNMLGEYENKDPTLLQTENDDGVLLTTIEDIVLNNLTKDLNPIICDYDVGDADPKLNFSVIYRHLMMMKKKKTENQTN